MATEIWAGPLGELRTASAAAGGTVLSTTPVLIQLLPGTRRLFIEGRNYSTAVVAQLAFNPYLIVLKTTDALATVTDYSEAAQDASTGTVLTLSSLDTLANGDYLLIGSHLPFRGVSIDAQAVNSNASALTVKYRKTDDTWADISATDNTAIGEPPAASMAQDGTVTWTVPTDWKKASLTDIGSPAPGAGVVQRSEPLYWTRWEWSAALDSSVTLNSLLALNRSTAYGELVTGRVMELAVHRGVRGIGCIEARTDAGTANLIVNAATAPGNSF